MHTSLAERTRAAAAALWWTALIGLIWMVVAYVVWLLIVSSEPTWLEWFYGGADWHFMRAAGLWMFAAFKLFLWLVVLVAIWVTLWSRRLGRGEPAAATPEHA